MNFAEALQAARGRKRLSMFAAAGSAGIAVPIYRMIEADRIHPDREKRTALCEALEFTWADDAANERD